MPADVVDDDTLRAVEALWASDPAGLPSVFKRPPQAGRLKSPQETPYAHLDCQYQRFTRGYGYRLDVRKVTITLRGIKADVVRGMGFALAIFNANLGAPNQPTLTYPSAARFIKWWPLNGGGTLRQEPEAKSGEDVWVATIEAEVTSVRTG